jgi:hypothetical protein
MTQQVGKGTKPVEDNLLENYRPFIGDVPLSAYAEPFPVPEVADGLTPADIERKKKVLKKRLKGKSFHPPIPLSDYCLIAPDRWAEENDETGCNPANACLLL